MTAGSPPWDTRLLVHREVYVFRRLMGLLVGLSIVGTMAGCVRTPPGFVAATPTPESIAPQIAPQVVAQVLRQRTATVKVGLQTGGSGGRAELTGPIEYTASGVNADLTGTINGNAVHLIVLGDTLYVSQLFQLSAGTTWLKMAAGGERASNSSYWVYIDEIVTGLSYVADETMLAGLAYNDAPAEVVDGVSTRTATITATSSAMLDRLKPPQLSRYQALWQNVTGARIFVAVGEDAIPRRLSMTPVGNGYYSTIELNYTKWAATTVAIAAPSGPEVRDYP
jgi:hypothetical protein